MSKGEEKNKETTRHGEVAEKIKLEEGVSGSRSLKC